MDLHAAFLRVFRDYKTLPEAIFGVKKTLFEAAPFRLKIHISMKSVPFLALYKAYITVENGFPESVRFHIVPLPNQYTGNWKVEI